MKNTLNTIVFLLCCVLAASHAAAVEIPDGTLLVMHADNVVGRATQRVTGDVLTHVAVVLDGRVYEADLPAVMQSELRTYARPRTTILAYLPVRPYTPAETNAMLQHARGRLGEPYRLRRYFLPSAKSDPGTWCSRFAKDTLNASGRYAITEHDGREPHELVEALRGHYHGPYRLIDQKKK